MARCLERAGLHIRGSQMIWFRGVKRVIVDGNYCNGIHEDHGLKGSRTSIALACEIVRGHRLVVMAPESSRRPYDSCTPKCFSPFLSVRLWRHLMPIILFPLEKWT